MNYYGEGLVGERSVVSFMENTYSYGNALNVNMEMVRAS